MFKEYNQKQNFLIPPSYDDFLWEKHQAKLLNNIINWLNLDFLYKSYNNTKLWTTAYNQLMLLKILFYWFMNNTFSSRKIANKLKSDIWFMFLAWNNKPDFRTINNFRKNKWELLEKVFVQIIMLAKEMWLIKFWTFSIDWTKIYANASKQKNIDLERLQEKIGWLFNEADRIDDLEDEEYWDNEDDIPQDLTDPEIFKEKLEKAKKKLKDLEKKAKEENNKLKENKQKTINKINQTDSDSRLMQMKRKDYANGYNCQIITENQFIIWNYISNNPWDTKDLIPSIEKLKENLKILPKNILADKWYASEENYEYLEKHNIKSYIPHPESNWTNLINYNYDKKTDTYKDIEWNIFKFKQFMWNLTWGKRWRPKKWEWQKEDDFKAKLYYSILQNWKKKYLYIAKNQKLVYKRNDKRLYSKKWQKLFKTRSTEVENPIWNIKFNLWFERFLLRWKNWVQIEWNLINMVHNLKKIMKILAS